MYSIYFCNSNFLFVFAEAKAQLDRYGRPPSPLRSTQGLTEPSRRKEDEARPR